MKAIEKLITFIHSEERHTMIREGRESLYLIKDDIGKAVVLYGQALYGTSDNLLNIDEGLKVVAIFSDKICCVVEKYIFSQWGVQNSESLPSGVVWFSDYVRELNDELTNIVFPKWYQELVPTPLKSKYWDDNDLEAWARYTLLDKPPFREGLDKESIVDTNTVAQILYGFVEKETAFVSAINKAIDSYNIRKWREMEIQHYINTHKVVDDFEQRIVDAIKSITAKTVVVTFIKHGKKSSGKISPEVIKRKCLHKDYFSQYDFNNGVEGKKVLEELDATSFGKSENNLYVKDISSITFRGREIYRRKEI